MVIRICVRPLPRRFRRSGLLKAFTTATGPGSGCSDCRACRDDVAAIRPMVPGLPKVAARGRLHAVADGEADMLHDRIVAVAIDHAGSAAVAHALSSVEVSDVAERPVPVVATLELEVPIQIKGLPPRETPERLRLATQVTLHVFDRRDRVQHGKLPAQRFDRLEGGVQLLGCESTSGDPEHATYDDCRVRKG